DRRRTIGNQLEVASQLSQLCPRDRQIDRVVVDDEYAAPVASDEKRGGVITRVLEVSAGTRLQMRGEPERAAAARSALDFERSIHQRDQAAGDRESQSGAAVSSRR